MFGKTKVRHRSTPGGGMLRPSHRPAARAAAVFLSLCMAFTMMPAPVFAALPEQTAETGLCEHHPVHPPECGYQEAEPGHPCEHKHTADCYTDGLICDYIEDEDMTASDSDAGHVHTQDCYELDCPHERGEHDEECGYTEGEEGVPCGYVCAECGELEEGGGNGNTTGGNVTGGDNLPIQGETKPELVQPDTIEGRTVTSFDELNEAVRNQTVKAGTPLEELALPDTLSATVQYGAEEPDSVVIDGVVWEPDALYEGESGEFIFTASATGYTPAQGVEWPVITVTVEEEAVVPDEIDALCAAIDALPTVEELYENAPGDAEPEFDDWVSETSAMLAAVPALWEQFLALSEDAEAIERITDARADKLAALNNLAERLEEMATLDVPTAPTVAGEMIFANGAELKIVAGETAGYTNILYDKNSDRTIGDTEYLKIGNTEPTAGGYDLYAYLIYGGSQDADVDGVTKITMTGGKVYDIYGGGRARSADADVKGTEIILSGGVVNDSVYGGGWAYASDKTASVTGNTSVTISGDAAVNMYVSGGGNAVNSRTTATVTGNAAITMTGGKAGLSDTGGKGICGGGAANMGGSSTVGSASVTITGGTAVAVYGGGWAGGSSQDNVTGAATVSLSGNAEVSGGVYGGGYTVSGGTSTAGSKIVTVGGGVKIGGSTAKGIVINGGTASVSSGVGSFVIADDLTESASVNVNLPADYDVSSNPTIATGAVEADLAKITLVGSGAEGKEAYFESNGIKVREKSSEAVPTPTVSGRNIIFANGAEIKIVAGETEGYTNILYDKNSDRTIGDTEYLKIGNTEPTAGGYDLSAYLIYGGSQDADVDGVTKITMTGGKVCDIYGGGRALSADVDVKGTELNLSGGLVMGNVYGGGEVWGPSKTASVTGDTSITLSGDVAVEFSVYGGGRANTGGISTVGSAIVEMTGGTAVAVYGGGWAGSSSQDNVTGAATVSLSGNAEVSGGVYGGGSIYNSGTSTVNSKTVTVGGGVKIGGSTAKGIVINGGATSVSNGVGSFVIADVLTESASVNVQLPAGYDIASNPTIATIAVKADLSKIKLVGGGAEGKEAYFESGAIKVREKSTAPAYGITLNQTGTYTFAEAAAGYEGQTPLTVTVKNTGNQPTGALTVGLSGEGHDAFALSPADIGGITEGETGTFKVEPVIGLGIGTYTALVTVTGGNSISASFTVSFTVTVNQDDIDKVEAAKTAVESGAYTIEQVAANTENEVKTALAGQINILLGEGDTGVTVTADSITISSFTAAIAGNANDPDGTSGSFSFTVALSKGSASAATDSRNGTITATAYTAPEVTGVTVSPAAAEVQKGNTQQFTAAVTGENNPVQTVTWSLEGSHAGGTGISNTGLLTIAPEETAQTLTVRATSAADAGKSGTATVTVINVPVTAYTITASAGSGGTVSPSGTVTVNKGESKTFAITPDSKYSIFQVTVDGADMGAVAAYTFENVTADHSISVTFRYVGGGSSSPGSSSTAPSTTTTTTAGENGTSTTTTQTTLKDNGGKTTTVTTEVTKDAAGNVTGNATTVTTDNITTSADQGSAVVMVRPDAAAINSAAQAAGATAASSMDILVAVPQDTVRSELQKADVSAVRMEVIIPKAVEDNPAVGTAGVTVEKETVDAARQTGKTVTVTVRDDTMAVKAVWSLDGQSMRNATGQSTDLNLGIHTAPVQSNDPIAEPVKPPVAAAGQDNGLVISLTADGTLLSAAKLTVPATNQTAITAGSTVALYRFDQTTGALHPVSGGVYLVDANGNVTITIPAGTRMGARETYVLLPAQGTVGTGTGAGSGTTHTVRKGDTLNQISRQYGCRVEDLLALNPGLDIYNLQVGSNLKVR